MPSSDTLLVAALTLAAVVCSYLAMGIFSKSKLNAAGKHCYIGGGSEGLGLSLACQLADKGAHVSIVSRSEAKLAAALATIEVRSPPSRSPPSDLTLTFFSAQTHRISPTQKFASYSCDLTSSESASATYRAAVAPFNNAPPSYVFACAGGSKPMFFTDMSMDEHWNCMEWNFKSALGTVYDAIQGFKEAKTGGTIVFTSSVLGLMSYAGWSSYSPSKYAIRGLADALRSELLLYNVDVHLFLPTGILSAGFELENTTKPELTKKIEGPDEPLTPDAVARELIKGLERNDYYITYEFVGHTLRNSRGIVPRNNVVTDLFWGIIGTVAYPFWRMFAVDREVRLEKARLEKAAMK
ncbi:3-dehydrosphinganine reductase [Pseudohyphozyma bogoriensis]|nr:3-dehydrosphinganine reductase [Pseudohyphozyma bogoriensis]